MHSRGLDRPGGAACAGAEFDELALAYLESAGDALVRGANGKVFCVLAHGNIERPGLRRTATVPEAGGPAFLLAENPYTAPLLVITVST